MQIHEICSIYSGLIHTLRLRCHSSIFYPTEFGVVFKNTLNIHIPVILSSI